MEVTEEMLEAGIGALYSELTTWDDAGKSDHMEALRAVFIAMWSARPAEWRGERDDCHPMTEDRDLLLQVLRNQQDIMRSFYAKPDTPFLLQMELAWRIGETEAITGKPPKMLGGDLLLPQEHPE